jgi:hypothetical protein
MYMVKYFIRTQFSHSEQLEIVYILADKRGWSSMYSLDRTHNIKDADVVINKLSHAYMARKFPDLKGLSVAVTGIVPVQIYINNKPWNNAPANFGGSLKQYHAYVIQHEMGHALGYHHVKPHADQKRYCPVMYQQTKGTINICQANPWIMR